MTEIDNWTKLITNVSHKAVDNSIFSKLLTKINQSLRPFQKYDNNFDLTIVKSNHQELFNIYKLTYEQLLIEPDIIDIFVEMPSLKSTSNNQITFNMIGVGKWIKFYSGNSSRIYFFDEEKTMISDKTLAEFLNKIDDVKSMYTYFGRKPIIYCKFKYLPTEDVINYLKQFDIITIRLTEITKKINFDTHENKILLDQTMTLTLCSNLSYGLSESFYQKPDDSTKEIMVQNKLALDNFLQGKQILITESVFEQSTYKIKQMAGSSEKMRFDELKKKLTIVPDTINPRFYYLKDIELAFISVAERENAISVTSSQRLCNKLDKYYREISYKKFICAQLVEDKYK